MHLYSTNIRLFSYISFFLPLPKQFFIHNFFSLMLANVIFFLSIFVIIFNFFPLFFNLPFVYLVSVIIVINFVVIYFLFISNSLLDRSNWTISKLTFSHASCKGVFWHSSRIQSFYTCFSVEIVDVLINEYKFLSTLLFSTKNRKISTFPTSTFW